MTGEGVESLTARRPAVSPERLVAEMAPPPHFAQARLSTYRPDPGHPSQSDAVRAVQSFADAFERRPRPWPWRSRRGTEPLGLYLDGGFGVGKTHLLASLWHVAPAPKGYVTFTDLTNLVGALGFHRLVQALQDHRLLCIDEFELDDPGDTVLVSTLMSRLTSNGIRVAATSNTLPGALGEGRFDTADFLREIQALAARFEVVRIDGEDYRHRGLVTAPDPMPDAQVVRAVAGLRGATLDPFPALLDHLGTLHPSRYGAMLEGVRVVGLQDVTPITDQSAALRLVVLADRLYERDVPVIASGVPFDEVFSPEMLAGGYRKKYFRAVSRLDFLARDGVHLVEGAQSSA